MKNPIKKRKLKEDPNIKWLKKLRNTPEYKKAYIRQSQLLDIALTILELRKKQKLTQKKLAKLMNTDQSVISRIEKGIENISLKRLFSLAEALGAQVKISFTKST